MFFKIFWIQKKNIHQPPDTSCGSCLKHLVDTKKNMRTMLFVLPYKLSPAIQRVKCASDGKKIQFVEIKKSHLWKRCTEHQSLPMTSARDVGFCENLSNVLLKSHIQHPVCFEQGQACRGRGPSPRVHLRRPCNRSIVIRGFLKDRGEGRSHPDRGGGALTFPWKWPKC